MENGLILGLRALSKADREKGNKIMWVYYTTDFENVKDRLIKVNSEPLRISAPPVGLKSEVYSDPEGNRFTLALKPS